MKHTSYAALLFVISDYPWTECLTEEGEFLAMAVVAVKVQSCFAVPCPHLSWKNECIRNIHNYPLTFHKCMYERTRRQNTRRNCGKDGGAMKLLFRSRRICLYTEKVLKLMLDLMIYSVASCGSWQPSGPSYIPQTAGMQTFFTCVLYNTVGNGVL